jgi:outer membrane immunogenic protein
LPRLFPFTVLKRQQPPAGRMVDSVCFRGCHEASNRYSRHRIDQFDPRWLVGVEGDWDWTSTGYRFCRITDQFAAPCFNNGFGFESISSKTDWLATVRGRIGYVWGNWLFYGTGGAAWGRVNTTVTLNCLVTGGCGNSAALVFGSSATSTTKAGWVAGLGAGCWQEIGRSGPSACTLISERSATRLRQWATL